MITSKISTTGQAVTGLAYLKGMLLGTDGVNDPEVTAYSGVSTGGTEIIPTTTYDSSALGLNGVMLKDGIPCEGGIYVEITCAGTVEVIIYYSRNRSIS